MKYYFAISSIILIFSSCKKETVANNPSSEYFPNTTGNYWKYKVVDSILNSSSIVELKIVGDKILPGGQNAKIWVYSYPTRIDTNYVFQIGDSIKFLDQNFAIQYIYKIPLQINNKWTLSEPNHYLSDSTYIIENRTFYLNDYSFEKSFLLHESGFVPNAFFDKNEWFCPTIGMVTKTEKFFQRIGNVYTKYLYWELIQYELK